MVRRRLQARRRLMLWSALVAATLVTGCNSLFGIHEGKPRPICVDPLGLLIDDMEDRDGFICRGNGRDGHWFVFGDKRSNPLGPGPAPGLEPTRIPTDGGRGTSQYAAHFAGGPFPDWGALMGFNLNMKGLAREPYDVTGAGGVTFWMKSDVPVSVDFPTRETLWMEEGGQCADSATAQNCNNHFSFRIAQPSSGWKEYWVPFTALTQRGGSVTWSPRALIGLQFRVPRATAFDVWVDDVRFYPCAAPICTPTCTDPDFPKDCPARGNNAAGCWPPGTDCAALPRWCAEPSLIDDMEDGQENICESGGRQGSWYVVTDETSTDLRSGPNFKPALIPGGRGTSNHAARLTGVGFTNWGATMGFNLNATGSHLYDAHTASGVKFWMKSDVAVSVDLRIPETIQIGAESSVGTCDNNLTPENCYVHLEFEIASTGNEWLEYEVPFNAFRQVPFHGNGNLVAGTATWDPSRLVGIQFTTHSSRFDAWVDDIRFYSCEWSDCVPTCSPIAPVACPASGGRPAGCWPVGTDCTNPPDRLSYRAIWGSGPDDVWAVGFSSVTLAGSILHWDGSFWSSTLGGTTHPIWGVWGSGPGDAWAVGDRGSILHWDSVAWAATATTDALTSPFNGVWGSGPDDVWAIEQPGILVHWNGSAWSSVTSVPHYLAAVWGSGVNDVWAVGDSGTILHWNGVGWTVATGETSGFLLSVWGSAPDDVWAVGTAGAVVHWTGAAWSATPSATALTLISVWGNDARDAWAVGDNGTIVHWDGTTWSVYPSGTTRTLIGVWGSGPNDVWAVGEAGTILHWDGSTWSPGP